MRADWTPEAEATLREQYPRMVPCPLPAVHSRVEILGRACTATDLTNEISPTNPTFKGHQRTVMWQHLSHDDVQKLGLTKPPYSYEVVAFTVCGHTSTHCDSISHIVPEHGARPIDQTPLPWHMAPGVWVEFSSKPPNSYITLPEIQEQLRERGLTIKPGSVFLFHTGWYKKFDTAPFEYIRDYPGLDEESAHWLADQGVICVGSDAPSVDSFNEVAVRMVQPVHMMCRERGVLNIENLRNIDRIPAREFSFIGLPLKIKNGCGSPIRAVALTEDR
jgi:kynurenine formamidase